MIYCLACNCGGVENLIRGVLHSAGLKDWLKIPVYQGKELATEILTSPELSEYIDCKLLLDYIKGRSSYAVVLGVKNGKTYWADAANGSISSRLDAEIVAKRFAE